MATSSPQLFYLTPGPMTESRAHADLLDGLPADVAGIVGVVQGLLVHVFWAGRYGLELTPEREAEVKIPRARAEAGPDPRARSLTSDRSPPARAATRRQLPRLLTGADRVAPAPGLQRAGALRLRHLLHARPLRGPLGRRVLERGRGAMGDGRRPARRLPARGPSGSSSIPSTSPPIDSWSPARRGSSPVLARSTPTSAGSSTCTASTSSGGTSSATSWRLTRSRSSPGTSASASSAPRRPTRTRTRV